MAMSAASAAAENAIASKILEAVRITEDEIDRQIEHLEKLDEDDLEGWID